tara:strand:+ start:15348 stop:16379 length:1032 start_codon:yes stop_codon:yes gene_type:complete
MGPEVYELEERLADYVGVKHCITCSSGTDALLIPLMAKNIGIGDAVITTPFTYIATAEVISLLGAVPIFVDVDPVTFNINANEIEQAIHKAKNKGLCPKAIIAVDLFGLPARYRLIEKIASKNNLFLIEDTAQGFGGSIRKKMAGSFGNVGSTSFFPAKPFGCYGDGGAIFTSDEELAKIMESIRVHGSGLDKYDNVRVGINGRLDTIQAAILLEKLAIFDNEITLRNQVSNYYSENISSKYKKPYIPRDYISSWAQYSILAHSSSCRNHIINSMVKHGTPIMIYYKIPLHLQKVYNSIGYKNGDFPITEKISKCIFSIPMHPYLSKKDQDFIIKILNAEYKN